jgi:hypothetical protein
MTQTERWRQRFENSFYIMAGAEHEEGWYIRLVEAAVCAACEDAKYNREEVKVTAFYDRGIIWSIELIMAGRMAEDFAEQKELSFSILSPFPLAATAKLRIHLNAPVYRKSAAD